MSLYAVALIAQSKENIFVKATAINLLTAPGVNDGRGSGSGERMRANAEV